MFSKRTHFDCLIVGGGPAGCVLACTLAGWGKRVCLIEKDGGPHPFPFQSVSADASAILKRNGIMTSARESGHPRCKKRVLIWGDGDAQVLKFKEEDCGLRIDRDYLDPDLRALAQALKVTVMEGAEVIGSLPPQGKGPVSIQYRGKLLPLEVETIVVATGRSHTQGLLPVALKHTSPDLFALTAMIRCEKKSKEMDVLESLPQGWFSWFAEDTCAPQAAVFTGIPHHEWREALMILKQLLNKNLAGNHQIERGSIRHLNATPRLVTTPTDILLLGDAACTLDPLLGRGLESSIQAAEMAAICTNTILEHPDLRSPCIQHMATHEETRYFNHLSQSSGLYLQEARFSDKEFWRRRHESCQVKIIPATEDTQLPMRLRIAEEVGRYPTLRRKGRVLERVIGMGKPGGPVHQSALGIPVAKILELVSRYPDTDDIIQSAHQDQDLYVHSKAKVTRALSELCRLGILESADDSAA